MADEQDQESGQGTEERIASLEAGQSSLESKVDKILGIVSGGSGQEAEPGEQPAGGANVADEIRAQLDERDRKKAAEDADKDKSDRLAAAEARIAELSEKPPAPMPRRVEKIMGWR